MAEKNIKLRADKVTMHYTKEGEGDTNLLFLHGWGINRTYWTKQMEVFKAEHTVYAVDLAGYGESTAERTEWTIEEFALDIVDFIKQLQLENVILIGHSMSGMIALDVVLKTSNVITGIIGVDNFKNVTEKITLEEILEVEQFIQHLDTDYIAAVQDYVRAYLLSPVTPAQTIDRVLTDFCKTDRVIVKETFRNLMLYEAKLHENLQMLPLRLYLINGTKEPTNEQALSHCCKYGYELRTITGTGHYPMIEKDFEFNQLLNISLGHIRADRQAVR